LKKVVFFGEILIDFITTNFTDDLLSAEGFKWHFGGSPANIAKSLADLGIEVVMVGKVGDDDFGRASVKDLTSRGVDVRYVQIDETAHTSLVFTTRSKGDQSFVPMRDADFRIKLSDREISEILEGASLLHFSSWPVTREESRSILSKFLEEARKRNVNICFDVNYRKKLWDSPDAVKTLLRLLDGVYLVKPSVDDSRELFGELSPEEYVEAFHRAGVKNVVLTLGKEGALVSDGKRMEVVPSMARKVVNTLGAGDGFWTGLYYGLIKGKDIFEASRIGSAIAALRLEREGASDPLPNIEEILDTYLRRL